MEADLNMSFQSIVIKGQSLSEQNDWRSPTYVTREKSVVSQEDQVRTF